MTESLKVFENAKLATPEALISALDHLKEDYSQGGGAAIMKYDKSGRWSYGVDQITPEDGSRWAINVFSFTHGFIAWGGDKTPSAAKLLGEVMVPMTSPKPDPGEVHEHATQGWQAQLGFSMKCISGEDSGLEARFSTLSKGGVRAVAELIGKISEQTAKDPSKPIPVVELGTSNYPHKNPTYGRVWVPVFKVVDWIGANKPSLPEVAETVVEAEEVLLGERLPGTPVVSEDPARRRRRG